MQRFLLQKSRGKHDICKEDSKVIFIDFPIDFKAEESSKLGSLVALIRNTCEN